MKMTFIVVIIFNMIVFGHIAQPFIEVSEAPGLSFYTGLNDVLPWSLFQHDVLFETFKVNVSLTDQ